MLPTPEQAHADDERGDDPGPCGDAAPQRRAERERRRVAEDDPRRVGRPRDERVADLGLRERGGGVRGDRDGDEGGEDGEERRTAIGLHAAILAARGRMLSDAPRSRRPRPDPIRQLDAWLRDAERAGIAQANAFALSTADADGMASVRFVLLRGIGPEGLT
jgi:hypothetical protein